jgi:hypothetical protein
LIDAGPADKIELAMQSIGKNYGRLSTGPPSYDTIGTNRRENRRSFSSGGVARQVRHTLESAQFVDFVGLFDIVDMNSGQIQGFCRSATYRSKVGQDCLDDQRVVVREHPRRVRLGLIEAWSILARLRRPSWHPRRVRLGLIEASKANGCPAPARVHPRRVRLGPIEACTGLPGVAESARQHPRRVRLGLIEARWSASRGWPYGWASETCAPRPH